MNREESTTAETGRDLPEWLAVLPLKNVVLFPGVDLPVLIQTTKAQRLVDRIAMDNLAVVAVAQRRGDVEDPDPKMLYDVGSVAQVIKVIKQLDGSYQVILRASDRVRLRDFEPKELYWKARVESLPVAESDSPELDAMVLNLRQQFGRLVELAGLPSELSVTALNVEQSVQLAYTVAAHLALTVPERQTILELPDLAAALERTTFYVTRQLETLELSQRIQERVRAGMDRRQREYFLREQLQAIKRELGEAEHSSTEVEELTTRLDEVDMPAEARQATEKELARLARIPPASAEYTVSRNYLDWLLEMPWSVSTQDNLDIRQAAEILDQDHFDLEKVKRRILEYLAVLQLKKDLKGPILCFVGPPGVGKTSLGQSIARSLGRKFIRVSLGGLRDEAEIRGHRRTYVGSLPGRIIQSIRRVGSNNPVFILDEIDKVGADFRGDPSSALLEVLDPEQNSAFSDHYLGVPFDLSKVIFIATANMLDPVPPALKDRMEVIAIPGYTEEEKLEIARRYLVGHQVESHGLTADRVALTDETIREIIHSYTREAGVRGLDRNIAAVCRFVAREVAEGREGLLTVLPEKLADILGPVRFLPETATRSWGPGITTGLAWTPSGGELVFIETLRTNGNGKLMLTGQLGEVMKESAAAALTYLRAHASELGIDEERLDHSDIHIHVPAGATAKDGPSAGVAIMVALVSLMSGRKARRDVAMTGEITLRGDILPVGGIKEKVLAARRAGICEVLMPQANAKDLVDIPTHLREGMTFHELQVISEALELTLEKPAPKVEEAGPQG